MSSYPAYTEIGRNCLRNRTIRSSGLYQPHLPVTICPVCALTGSIAEKEHHFYYLSAKVQNLQSGVHAVQILAMAQDAKMEIMGRDFPLCAKRLPKALKLSALNRNDSPLTTCRIRG
jgi:hypothetical protein